MLAIDAHVIQLKFVPRPCNGEIFGGTMNTEGRSMKICLMAIGFIFGAIAIAHEGHDGKLTTINGTVIDTGCYVSHKQHGRCPCLNVRKLVRRTVSRSAILDEKGVLYMPIAVEHKDQNTKLMPFIEKKVKVTGTVMEKGGMRYCDQDSGSR